MVWAVLGAFLFAFMFMLPKLVSGAVPPQQVAFLRYFAGFLTILPFFLGSYGPAQGLAEITAPAKRRLNLMHALRASCGVANPSVASHFTIRPIPSRATSATFPDGVTTRFSCPCRYHASPGP